MTEDKKQERIQRPTLVLTNRILTSIDELTKQESIKFSDTDVLSVFVKIFSNIEDPIIITDLNMNIVEVNNSFEKLTGFDRHQTIGKNVNFFYSDDNMAEIEKLISEQLHIRGYFNGEVLCKKSNGDRWFSWISISPAHLSGGEPFAYISIARDITERKRLEEKTKKELELAIKAQRTILLSLANLAESRDSETGSHLERMRFLCAIIAKALIEKTEYQNIVNKEFVEVLPDAAVLHDIGKVAIPDNILLKPGALDAEEWKIMKQHSIVGGRILLQAANQMTYNTYLKMAADIAFFHHEKFDGSGYPYALSKENIPLSARIVSIVDAYDCIRSDRVYKKALSHEEATLRIMEQSGMHFDSALVKIYQENEDKIQKLYK